MDIVLEELYTVCPEISKIQCDYYSEGCMVALINQKHSSGISLKVEGDFSTEYNLKWQMSPNTTGWKNEKKIAETGATAIAFFLVHHLTEYTIAEEAVNGTGIDNWLSYKKDHDKYDELNFMSARLEISGINKGTTGTINARTKGKKKQTEQSEGKLPAFVAVTEFGNPKTIFSKK